MDVTNQTSFSSDHAARLAALTTALVEIPSITRDTFQCGRVIGFVESIFRGRECVCRHIEHQGVHSLLISPRDTLSFRFLLCGHLDVVPAAPHAFTPRLEGRRLHGRGTADMKGNCALMIDLMERHLGNPLFEEVGLLLTTDEETGGEHGVGYVVEQLGLKADVAFIPDGGDPFVPCVFEKGGLVLKLRAKGIGKHGAQHWKGVNAIDLLIEDVQAIRNAIVTASEANPWGVSGNLGILQGGQARNLVPSDAFAVIDFRYPAEIDPEEILRAAQSAVRHSSIEEESRFPAVSVDEHSPALQCFLDTLVRRGFERKTMREFGASDARWFVDQRSTCIIVKPEGSAYHADDEWVDVESLATLSAVTEEFVLEFLKGR